MTGATAHATLQEQFEALLYTRDIPPAAQIGPEWFQITEAELEVFEIDLDRFDRMVMAFHAYEAVKDIVQGSIWDETLLVAARADHPEWCKPEHSFPDFAAFAAVFAGITIREAHAIYYRQAFHDVRIGVTTYADEEPPAADRPNPVESDDPKIRWDPTGGLSDLDDEIPF
jgi:hypothetical protein